MIQTIGNRPPVSSTQSPILERLAAGESNEQIIQANPRLTPDDIRAALAFAAQVLHADVIYPVNADGA